MTLDEAIKHCEEVAETKRQDAELAEISGCDNTSKQCETCAEEHRLLAEWLTELKMYREHFISAKMINDLESGKKVIEHLEQMPPAQPEIIRCKDCKHWDGVDTCDVIDAPVWDNDFCSMAERRSNE